MNQNSQDQKTNNKKTSSAIYLAGCLSLLVIIGILVIIVLIRFGGYESH